MSRRRDRKEDKPRQGEGHIHGWRVGNCRTCHARCSGCKLCACQVDAVYGMRVRANLAAAQQVHEGKAFGGPRDGIKIKASARWDGKMHKNETGRYEWQGNGWQWLPAPAAARREY